ncbi:hypothetical protein GYMLUDRAFT_251156 [Collybiopsis luxurians FD-317 M1]|uniref:Uncharacterized protein n=1 Tax=Collybiopsis luxurians FD-317 M1 TaxID=944289 RepID=A0A0D0BSI0_9AGAR|nr:hypothetical protein GYMLUDRAFT_251156 [Collybiopsis luxurians FD-317 M1]
MTYGRFFAQSQGGGSDDGGVGVEYVGADGELADVTEFMLDTGLNTALQFDFGELGLLGLVFRDKEREKEREREQEREKERGLGKRIHKHWPTLHQVHQLAGIHPSLILNPSLGSAHSSSTSTSPPSSSSTDSAASTASLIDAGWGKKKKKIKEAKSKKDKKDKVGVGGGGGRIYLFKEYEDFDDCKTTSSMTVRPMISCCPLCGNSLNQSKEMDFEGMLQNGTLHTMDAHGGGMSVVEAGMTDNENKEDGKYSMHSRMMAMHDGLLEGGMAPRMPGSGGLHSQLQPELMSSVGHEHANNKTSATATAATPVLSPTMPLTNCGVNIIYLPAFSSLPSTSKQHQPSTKPKGLKVPTTCGCCHLKQNLILAEYHTVEFEVHLTSSGEMEEESNLFKANRTTERGDIPSEGDGFIKEAACRRRVAQLAEWERLKSER